MQGDLRSAAGSGSSAEAAAGAGRSLLDSLLGLASKSGAAAVEPNPGEGPRAEKAAQRLGMLLYKYRNDPAAAEGALLKDLAGLHAAGLLEPTLALLASDPRLAKHLPPMPEAQRGPFVKRLSKIIGAELEMAGLVPGVTPFEEWEKRADRQLAQVGASAFLPRRAGEKSLLEEPGFIAEMEALTGDRFQAGNSAELHSDGAASYAARNALIAGAKKSVHLMAWGLYDDKAGRETVDLLIAKKREGVDVKVIVDGQTVEDSGHGRIELARLSAAGVEVILFHDARRKYDGLHAKMLVVDGEAAVLGGRNVGDPYLHADAAGLKWRDMDVLVRGPAAAAAARRLAEVWNEQVLSRGIFAGLISLSEKPEPPAGTIQTAVSYSKPAGEATILLGMLKAMAGATRRIRIENAYFITFPSVRRAILDALARGVEVQILTNSQESIDEPIVAVPILESLPELIAAGVQAFLKRGQTLHAKFMTVDGVYANVTSLNVHPRSDRYEHESALAVLDQGFTAGLDAEFDADIAEADRIARVEDLRIPRSPLTFIIRRYLFNQL